MYKILLVLLLTSCAVSKEPDCFERAIVLYKHTNKRGVDNKYLYLDAHYPGYRIRNCTLKIRDEKIFEVFTIYPLNSKKTVDIYFNLTRLYKKPLK